MEIPRELKNISIVNFTKLKETYVTIISEKKYKSILVKINNKIFKNSRCTSWKKITNEHYAKCEEEFRRMVGNIAGFEIETTLLPSDFGYDVNCIKIYRKG